MRVIGVIPARMGSTRFPGKPLASIRGVPMLEHVYRRSQACSILSEIVIATCDDVIVRAAATFGARAVMTSADHARASDRVAEAVAQDDADIVVMIQGDEPLILPEMIEAAVEPMLRDTSIHCVNLAGRILSESELADRNTIKLVASPNGRALYFSREAIPSAGGRTFSAVDWRKQVCVIPFRRDALLAFASLPRGRLEELESIDMLRFLENGVDVHIVPIEHVTHAVDVPADIEIVTSLLARNPWHPDGNAGVRA